MSAMEEAIESRQVRYLFVDEAHHFLLSCRDEYLMNLYMETLKSISNKGELKLVMDGNYELLRFLEGSGQLARRTKVINFSPYLASSSGDIEAFEEAFLCLLFIRRNYPTVLWVGWKICLLVPVVAWAY
ncbi:TniB family NTP-binding protein [Endozoicomonas sp. YOMI1]|uniref:TniB family NTP-binding protein n=1 Tax=Endozoicomonas sp. YOMI1 TaxID=2828739 RepID=UPI002148198B|nr:TniB family NTP-binding protein [Endozoicomonas sp. YOMI1]